jgi:glutathione synthase
MSLIVAVQMDPIERIRIAGDSTFALLLEAQSRGHTLLYYTPDKLTLDGPRVVASVQPLSVKDVQGGHTHLGDPHRIDLEEVDVVLLRQDPPFDLAYITTTYLLERIQPRVLVVNNPRAVRDAPEKLFVMDFPELMPPTLISRERVEIELFRARHGAVVMKPLYGSGGAAVFRVDEKDANIGSLFDLFSVTFREPWVIQKFLPAVNKGDKRVILVDGEPLGAVNRVPVGDDIRANMVRGGSALKTELTERELDICRRVGPTLKDRGLVFVGLDIIDGYLTEINVTSPTGLRSILQLTGINLAAAIWEVIETKKSVAGTAASHSPA